MEEKEKTNKKRAFQKFLNWLLCVCLFIGAYIMVKHWMNNPSQDDTTNSPSSAHQQPKYRAFDFQIKGSDVQTEFGDDLYVGTVTDSRILVKLDTWSNGKKVVTTFDFNPQSEKGTWITIITDPSKPFYNQKTKFDGKLKAVRTSDRFLIFQLTLDYQGKPSYGALVPVATGS